jgi:hypothetical protein
MKRKGNQKPALSRLCEMSVMDINSSLIAFVQQIKKPDGEPYRADVLLYFISGKLFLHIQVGYWNFIIILFVDYRIARELIFWGRLP